MNEFKEQEIVKMISRCFSELCARFTHNINSFDNIRCMAWAFRVDNWVINLEIKNLFILEDIRNAPNMKDRACFHIILSAWPLHDAESVVCRIVTMTNLSNPFFLASELVTELSIKIDESY